MKRPRIVYVDPRKVDFDSPLPPAGVCCDWQPLITYKKGRRLQLVLGQKRLAAALQQKQPIVPALVAGTQCQAAEFALRSLLAQEASDIFFRARLASILEQDKGAYEAAKKLAFTPEQLRGLIAVTALDDGQRDLALGIGLSDKTVCSIAALPREKRDQALAEAVTGSSDSPKNELIVSGLWDRRCRADQRCRIVVKDIRIFINTIANAVEVMKRAGIDASARRMDRRDYIEYMIRIPFERGD